MGISSRVSHMFATPDAIYAINKHDFFLRAVKTIMATYFVWLCFLFADTPFY